MPMFNDISWGCQDHEQECELSANFVSICARRFSPGRWSFLGPGSEKKRFSIHVDKKQRDRVAELMMINAWRICQKYALKLFFNNDKRLNRLISYSSSSFMSLQTTLSCGQHCKTKQIGTRQVESNVEESYGYDGRTDDFRYKCSTCLL